MRTTQLIPKYIDRIPREKEQGVLYISNKFGLAVHLCACGCGGSTVTPIKEKGGRGWILTDTDGFVSLRPSIGNWSGEKPYHAHYFITNNQIEWKSKNKK